LDSEFIARRGARKWISETYRWFLSDSKGSRVWCVSPGMQALPSYAHSEHSANSTHDFLQLMVGMTTSTVHSELLIATHSNITFWEYQTGHM
jgi:hypothetical protein